MPTPRYRMLRILAGLLIFLLGCPPPSGPPREVFISGVELAARAGLTLLGEVFMLAPDSTGSFLVQVRNPETGDPITNGEVEVMLANPNGGVTPLFAGETDSQGMVQVSFQVPDEVSDPDQVLVVESRTPAGTRRYEQNVFVGRAYNILVSTDKPVYQPGQTIHIRALALDTLELAAAQAQEISLVIADGAGNKLMRQVLTTSEYGVAAFDFVLDSQAGSGDYTITAEIGPVSSSRTVEVKPYTLPRFKIDLATDQPFYLPGAVLTGTVQANYFFGKPVAQGEVRVRAVATDIDSTVIAEIEGETDAEGNFTYSLVLPDYLVGAADDATATVKLEVTVIDTANHAESVDDDVTVAASTVLVEAVPESGNLQPGIANIVYLNTSYPDGRATPASLVIQSPLLPEPVALTTDEYGLASLVITPTAEVEPTLYISTTTPAGAQEVTALSLHADSASTALLLRPDRAEYHIGDTMNLDIYVGGHAQTVYLDVIKGRQTFALVALPVVDGLAQAAIDVDGSLLGTLELNAYALTDRGEIVRDRRLALVNPAPAKVTITADAEVYRPGDTAQIEFQVSREGAPMVGALGVSIVDESVFAVGAQEPGFARTYFLLERELLEPRYEIHNFTDFGEDDTSPYDKEEAATVAAAPHDPTAAQRNLALSGLFAQELIEPMTMTTAGAVADAPLSAEAWAWVNRLALIVPLVGLVLFDGTRRRRRWLFMMFVAGAALAILAACSAAPAAPAAQAPAASETTATRGTAESPRLRQFFPETLYWNAEVATDAAGRATLDIPIADSITSWRVSVLASDAEGNLGSAQSSLRVFQEFFVEPDLPRFLTVDDEISVPIAVYNYLETAQTIDLTIAAAGWFEPLGPQQLTVEIGPNEVGAVYVPIRVTAFGDQVFTVEAIGSGAGDAVARPVQVLPNGIAHADVVNGRVQPEQTLDLVLPPSAIDGTGRVTVKLYPGIVAQALDGLEGLLGIPTGCFEQTSSVNYPNILVLDYLRTTGQQNPRVELRAEQMLNLGYQRLLQFEVPGTPGGFSLFGDPPADTMLTAYGLHQFKDFADVAYVDPDLIQRAIDFLLTRQQMDGAWNPEGKQIYVESVDREDAQAQADVAATAYVAWALAGTPGAHAAPAALDYITKHLEIATADSYVLALVANAYLANDRPADEILDELAARARPSFGGAVHWPSNVVTWLHSSGPVVEMETTAMAALALVESPRHRGLAEQALQYLTDRRGQFGSYGSTQATVLALKALVRAALVGGEGGASTITVRLGDGEPRTIQIDDNARDVVQMVTFDDVGQMGEGPLQLHLALEGNRAVEYQVTTGYYVPWATGPTPTPSSTQPPRKDVRIDVSYDKTELAVNDVVQVTAEVEVLAEGMVGTLLVDLGVPPGFSPQTDDLDALVEAGMISRYELTGRQIIFYLTDVPSGVVTTLTYGLQARFPIRAQAPQSTVYNYYAPEQQDTVAPKRIVVTLGTPD